MKFTPEPGNGKECFMKSHNANDIDGPTIITHPYPDVDSCTGVWLYCHLRNIPISKVTLSFNREVCIAGDDHICIDTGGGIYDHHDSNDYTCATNLVALDLGIGDDRMLIEIVDFALRADNGKLTKDDTNIFSLVALIDGLNSIFQNDYEKVVRTYCIAMDAYYASGTRKYTSDSILKNGIRFTTKKGQGIACVSTSSQVAWEAHRRGFAIYVYVDPSTGYSGFTTSPDYDVSFTNLYRAIVKEEPDADWFLHSSKRLLLCGSKKAPTNHLTKMNLEQLVRFVEKYMR